MATLLAPLLSMANAVLKGRATEGWSLDERAAGAQDERIMFLVAPLVMTDMLCRSFKEACG